MLKKSRMSVSVSASGGWKKKIDVTRNTAGTKQEGRATYVDPGENQDRDARAKA